MRQTPAQLPEEIGMYLDRLRAQCETIDAVWLLHPRPADSGRSEWHLLAFGDQAVLDAVRADSQWHRRDVVLWVVLDGDRFASGWGSETTGRLSELGWRVEDPELATFAPPSSRDRASAVRVR